MSLFFVFFFSKEMQMALKDVVSMINLEQSISKGFE